MSYDGSNIPADQPWFVTLGLFALGAGIASAVYLLLSLSTERPRLEETEAWERSEKAWAESKAEQRRLIQLCEDRGGVPIVAVVGGPQLRDCAFKIEVTR